MISHNIYGLKGFGFALLSTAATSLHTWRVAEVIWSCHSAIRIWLINLDIYNYMHEEVSRDILTHTLGTGTH